MSLTIREALMRAYVRGWYDGLEGYSDDARKSEVADELEPQTHAASTGILDAIRDRVVNGRPHGGFVEHVAACDWERALATADLSNRAAFGEIMAWRLNNLPRRVAEAVA